MCVGFIKTGIGLAGLIIIVGVCWAGILRVCVWLEYRGISTGNQLAAIGLAATSERMQSPEVGYRVDQLPTARQGTCILLVRTPVVHITPSPLSLGCSSQRGTRILYVCFPTNRTLGSGKER